MIQQNGEQPVGIGVIGFGGFGLFAVQQFIQVPGATVVGMAGTHREAAYSAAERFNIPAPVEIGELISLPNVDLVYIATPPFLHYEQAMAALRNGKHVICEKPLAITLEQADEMITLARESDLLLTVNLMQRYNPLYDIIAQIFHRKPLGEFLHGYFENWASDEGLRPDHWFWDRDKSGGIFIEHGVHFFDMMDGWLGEGEVVCAQRVLRHGSSLEEQVQCTVRYGGDRLVNFYHGFHQPGRLDRQEMRLLFERGDVTLYEWVPTAVRIHGVADERDMHVLHDLFPRATIDVDATYGGADRACRARHRELDVYQMFTLHSGQGDKKMHRYSLLLRSMLEDQLLWVRNRTHRRNVTEDNGRRSLAMAVRATELAARS